MTVENILKQYWGYNTFRPLQKEIIASVLEGKDTLALLPTGGGKSICFQVPAMAMEGLCLVVSPLIALMKDQVDNLRRKSITAFAIYSGMTRKEVIHTLKTASSSNCKFLYVSPERLETKLFLEYLPALNINLLTVDEAHCISQWGYDFRPPYLRIAALREQLPGVPALALTASATATVQKDICNKLEFKQCNTFRQSFERPNLSYSVFNVDAKIIKLVEILKNVPGSSIVYCRNRKKTKEIAEQLRSYHINADFYHAGLNTEVRTAKQEEWIKNKIRVIVSTNAFGMGIDKPDVRSVIHVDPPDSFEHYYQEAGRAGRDGKKAYAVLLYHERDLLELKEQVELRFPPLEQIRSVYQAIMNYLQIPDGSGEGSYYEFELGDFLHKFKLASQLVIHSLKVLEHENLVTFNEQVFIASKAAFTCNKDNLYAFETANPLLEPVIKALLRSYEGIFNQEVNIHEKSLAWSLRMDQVEVVNSLQQLNRYGIISYLPQKDKPQLYFIQNRVRAEYLVINMVEFNTRKQHYKNRVEAFIGYVKSTTCRSRQTGNYFGDEHIKPCGICDNCLLQQRSAISAAEFTGIEGMIMTALQQPVHSRDIITYLKGIRKEKAWKVINFLVAERKIVMNDVGMISVNRES